jgi:G3E family GTPase
VADPIGIFMTFADPHLHDRIRLDSVTCVVDAEQVFAYPEYPELMQLKLRQIASSDMLILNKVDLAGPEQMARVRAWIDDHFHRVRVVEANFCDVPYEILLGVGRFAGTPAAANTASDDHDGHRHEHGADGGQGQAFGTWSYVTDRPLSMSALKETAARLPAGIFRCKGVVRAAEAPKRRALLQVVGRRVDVTLLDEWDGDRPATRIVAIGAPGSIDDAYLRRCFDACAVPHGGAQNQ